MGASLILRTDLITVRRICPGKRQYAYQMAYLCHRHPPGRTSSTLCRGRWHICQLPLDSMSLWSHSSCSCTSQSSVTTHSTTYALLLTPMHAAMLS